MGNEVYANGMEVSCKAAQGKFVCAFPDVCFTPPQTPATPPGVPIPYPNTGMASDTTEGSKTVQISGEEVMLKDKSFFKQSTGDEAGSAPKKGVITSKNKGKVYFNSWSMDVKFEGENVVRHFDLTTHNHASQTGQTPPWPYADRMQMALAKECDEQREKVKEACGKNLEKAQCPDDSAFNAAESAREGAKEDFEASSGAARKAAKKRWEDAKKVVDFEAQQYSDRMDEDDCQHQLKCILVPYDDPKHGKMCCAPQQPDHLVPQACFKNISTYNKNAAPCMCAEGIGSGLATHGLMGMKRNEIVAEYRRNGRTNWKLHEAVDASAKTTKEVNKQCDEECLKAQLMNEHKKMGMNENTDLEFSSDPAPFEGKSKVAQERVALRNEFQSGRG